MSWQDLPIGGVVIRDIEAKDADAGINALVEYKVVQGVKSRTSSSGSSLFDTFDQEMDGYGIFEFPAAHSPVLTLRQTVDYESIRRYLVTIVASVNKIVLFFKKKNQLTKDTTEIFNDRIERLMSKTGCRRQPPWRSISAMSTMNHPFSSTSAVRSIIEVFASRRLIRLR